MRFIPRRRPAFSLFVCLALYVLVFMLACGGQSNLLSPPAPAAPQGAPPPAGVSGASDEFTIVVFPDTQYYAQESNNAHMGMFMSMVNWVAANRGARHIAAVIGVGDIVQCGSVTREWENADRAYRVLDAAGIPYVPTIGNHDYDGGCGEMSAGRSALNYNRNFGRARLAGRSWYGNSTFPAGSSENFFVTFSAGSRQFLVIALEFYPRDAALAWAQSVIDAHPDRDVIVTTHACVNSGDRFIQAAEPRGPHAYGLHDGNDGEALWNKFLRRNARVVAVLNGHFYGAGRMVLHNDAGRPVPLMLSNYQADANGGNGFLRILRFRPAAGAIEVQTFSPFLNDFMRDGANEFSVPYR